MKANNRFIFADILRIAATVSVVTIHTVGQLFYTDLNSIPIDLVVIWQYF